MEAISIRDLSIVRGRPVLSEITASIPAGTITGLLGPSGSGKTTLMRAIIGVQKITGGSVDVLGSPAGTASLRRRIGYVSQSPSVYADLSVRANVRYFGAMYGVGISDVDSVISSVELAPYADTRVANLSGGQHSRVSLACALVGRPEVLILDEPTVGLDPVLRVGLWQTFERLADDGVTLLVSSHVLDEAAHCSRLLLLRDGRLLADTTTDELKVSTGTDDLDEAFLRLVSGDVSGDESDRAPGDRAPGDRAPGDRAPGDRAPGGLPGAGRHRAVQS